MTGPHLDQLDRDRMENLGLPETDESVGTD
jgi:hypothetical protein